LGGVGRFGPNISYPLETSHGAPGEALLLISLSAPELGPYSTPSIWVVYVTII